MKILHIGLTLLGSITLCGCAEFPHVDATYGHAYAALIRDQTVNPRAAEQAHGPAPADGARLEGVIKAHNGAVSKAVAGRVQTGAFQVGGGGSGGGGG